MCAKVAWVWPPAASNSKRFWLEEKRDSMQYTIDEIAKEHDVLLLAPVDGQPQQIGWKHLYDSPQEALLALRDFNPDVINLNLFGSLFNGQIATEFQKSLITIYDHGGHIFCPFAKHVDILFTNLEYRRKLLLQRNIVPPEKVVLNPHGADTRCFYPDDSVEKSYTGIMVADFRRRKQQHLLIENWLEVTGKLILIGRTHSPLGEPDYVQECRALVERLSLSKRVEIREFVPHDELPRIINSAEIGINLSVGGAGSRSTTEMMACGLPMVVLRTRHSEDWVKSGGLQEAGPNAIGAAVNHLKNNPTKYKALREAVLKTIMPYTYEGMLDIFKKIIEGAPSTC